MLPFKRILSSSTIFRFFQKQNSEFFQIFTLTTVMSEWASNIRERSEARTKCNLGQFTKSTIPFHHSTLATEEKSCFHTLENFSIECLFTVQVTGEQFTNLVCNGHFLVIILISAIQLRLHASPYTDGIGIPLLKSC